MNLFRTPPFLPWLYPTLTWRIETSAKEIYLTFDDGPVSGPTEFALEVLQKSKAQATFFCIGNNIVNHPSVFRRVVQGGHIIGNHTFHHLSGWKTSTQIYLDNVKLCEDQIHGQDQSSGIKSLFRPPYGRITRRQIKSLKGHKIVMWDVLTHDYAQSLSPDYCLRGALRAARPGSIVVFHDSHKAEKNMMYVLPRFIDQLAGLGYTFKSLL